MDREICTTGSSCVKTFWTYFFIYDTDDLPPDVVITGDNVSGVICQNCFTQWVESKICVEDSDTIDFSQNVDGCITGDVKISADADNEIEARDDGIYAPEAGGLTSFFLYGDGSDGDFTVLNGEELILPFGRACFFNNLTINAGGILHPWGVTAGSDPTPPPAYMQYFPIYVKGTLTINGALSANGTSPIVNFDPSAAYSSITPGNKNADDGPGGGDCGGSDGGAGQTGVGPFAGDAFVDRGPEMGYMGGGSGGIGGDGGIGAAGGNPADYLGTCGFNAGAVFKPNRLRFDLVDYGPGGICFFNTPIACAIGGGNSGGGGGGGGKTAGGLGGRGGRSGAGAGSVYVAAKTVVIGATGSITANGGNGHAGTDGDNSGGGTAGGGGGGSGGGGGLIYMIYDTITNAGILQVNPGTGAAAGVSAGTPTGGTAGTDGNPGNIVRLNMTLGVFE